jgi:thiol-disulfide isomerase/thioredoxin
MTKYQIASVSGLVTLIAGVTLSVAAEPTLKVGDPAPKLQTGKWVQGEPVKDFEKGKAYIVEFWATWCGPCRVSIPHLNEVANKFKDKGLVVIGQDCWERDESLVGPFVEKMGDKMTYRVALDDKNGNERGKMAETWMAAAGQNGIPSAFVIDTKGIVAWIGHPMSLQEAMLEEVLAGKFDIQAAADKYAREKKNEDELNTVWRGLNMAMRQKKWDEASEKLSEVEKIMPDSGRDNLDMIRLNILFGKGEYPSAYKLATKLSDSHKDNAAYQNQLAWQIATDPNIKERDLGVAETIAKRAVEASQSKDAGILDTLARVMFMRDQKDAAIATQEKAVKLADADTKNQLQSTLDSYKKGELPKAE